MSSAYAFITFSFLIIMGVLFFLFGDLMIQEFGAAGNTIWGIDQITVYMYMRIFGIVLAILGIIGLILRPFIAMK